MLNAIPVLWWMARTTGLVAEMSLLAAILCGLAIAGGVPNVSKKRAMELHEAWTLAAVLSTAAHAVVIGVDAASHVPALALVVPFASATLRGPVALGTLGLWGIAVVATSALMRKSIPAEAWRALHAVAYATFVVAVAHALVIGTDARHPVVLAFHSLAVGSVVAASVWRAAMAQIPKATPV